ncbi:MAG TPA: GntG family PLP-dependent aldolase [Chloroflexota bacterium]
MRPGIDLRSDTITLPTEAMREAMRQAEVGDDQRGDDPTVKRLEALAAEMLGKEAGLLVLSGTMGNLVGVLSHVQRGDEVIADEGAHILTSEVGWLGAVAGAMVRTVPSVRGVMDPAAVERAIRTPRLHHPRTGLLCLENTHNRAGGTVMTPAQTKALCDVAHRYGVPVHLDGARIFNAAVALGVDVKDLVRDVDSVTFCLSKGLSAPLGSVLVGSAEFIERARKVRQMVGGGMRQAGVIAAPGIVALQTMVDRLAEDHANARRLAEGLVGVEGLRVDLETVQTNMVRVEIALPGVTSEAFARRLEEEGVHVLCPDASSIRLVTHRHIGPREVDAALEIFRRVARACAREAVAT